MPKYVHTHTVEAVQWFAPGHPDHTPVKDVYRVTDRRDGYGDSHYEVANKDDYGTSYAVFDWRSEFRFWVYPSEWLILNQTGEVVKSMSDREFNKMYKPE